MLPRDVMDALSLKMFKTRLDRHPDPVGGIPVHGRMVGNR